MKDQNKICDNINNPTITNVIKKDITCTNIKKWSKIHLGRNLPEKLRSFKEPLVDNI